MAVSEDRAIPGTIKVYRSSHGPTFVSMFAQWGMGRPYSYNNVDREFTDGFQERIQWFKGCLSDVADLKPVSVAMPFQIGCGLAGGNWKVYENIISDWAEAHPSISVVLYRL